MPRVSIGTAYIDRVSSLGLGTTARPDLINLAPENNESDVPEDTAIELKIVDVSVQGLAALTRVDITTVGQGTVAAFIQGTGFHATYSASVFTPITSPGAGITDEHALQLIRATPFLSNETVTVRVRAQTNDGLVLDRTYSFQVEDTTKATIVQAFTRGLTTLVLKFSEPVLMTNGLFGALRVKEISGHVELISPNFISAELANFTQDSVSDYICVTGSEQALNNSYFTISAFLDSNSVRTAEQTIVSEEPLLSVEAWTGPYLITAQIDVDRFFPAFTPAVTAAEQEDPLTVVLTLDQELSPDRPYTVTAVNVADVADPSNVQPSTTVAFTAEPLPVLANRSFSLWDMIPEANKRDDTTGDLQRFVRTLDEPVQLMLSDVDRFGNLFDIDTVDADALDAHLASLGNPFTFVHDELLKRKTIINLVDIFKDSGTDRGIENAVQFFLGLSVNVLPFHLLDGWILGESLLGEDTILGTDVKFLLYSFEIVSPVTLTQDERAIITEIANTLKPAHTHFVRFVEP